MNIASIEQWIEIQEYLKIFRSALGLTMNLHKPTVYWIGLYGIKLQRFKIIFPYQFNCLEYGLKYLGCFIKPDGYCITDWIWIISKFEKHIHNCCSRWLTLGGRVTLIKVFLNCIPVF